MLGYTPPNPSTKIKLNLNKRVAFPMQSSPSGTSQVKLSSSGLPLPQAGGSSLPPSIMNTGSSLSNLPPPPPPSVIPSGIGSSLPKESKQDEENELVKRDFALKVFSELDEGFPKDDKHNKYENIHKSLEILRTTWLDGKMELKYAKILFEMAKAFQVNDMDKAAECHRAFIMDNGDCLQWTLAFRHLIVFRGWEKPEEKQEEPITESNEVKLIAVSDESKSDSKNNFSKIYHI